MEKGTSGRTIEYRSAIIVNFHLTNEYSVVDQEVITATKAYIIGEYLFNLINFNFCYCADLTRSICAQNDYKVKLAITIN